MVFVATSGFIYIIPRDFFFFYLECFITVEAVWLERKNSLRFIALDIT